MTSTEINEYLYENNYSITTNNYMNIILTSPQINYINRDDNDVFVIKTDDRYCWSVRVKN